MSLWSWLVTRVELMLYANAAGWLMGVFKGTQVPRVGRERRTSLFSGGAIM